MTNILFFSDYIKLAAKKILFLLIVCGRFIIILFSFEKGIKLLHLEYAKKYQFDNSYLTIHYRFKNALWYNFKNIKKTTESKVIVLNLINVPEIPIELKVYGFLRTKTYYISIIPESTLKNKHFKTSIIGINEIEFTGKPIERKEINITTTFPRVKTNNSELQVKHPTYNQTDFL